MFSAYLRTYETHALKEAVGSTWRQRRSSTASSKETCRLLKRQSEVPGVKDAQPV
jgi:hypothetical protein